MRTLLFLCGLIAARACCPTCECHRVCQAPNITASMTLAGLNIRCNGADCACVKDELDGCTYGGVWSGLTVVGWEDSRWSECITVTHTEPLRASAVLRWWDNSIRCMGHSILHIETNLLGVDRDVWVDFEQTVSYQHNASVHHVFYVSAVSGSSDDRPIVGQSKMYFNVEMNQQIGAHIEILNCSVQTTSGPDGEVLTVNRIQFNGTQDGNIQGELNENKTSMTYTAFWDDVSNSPFHTLMCDYAIFNGTSVSTHPSHRKYMIADPNEDGVLWDESKSNINGRQLGTSVVSAGESSTETGHNSLGRSSGGGVSSSGSSSGHGSGSSGSGGSEGRCDNTSDLHLTIIQNDSHYSPFRRLRVEPTIEWTFGGEYTTHVERVGRFQNGRWYEGEDPMQVGMYVLFAWCLGVIFLVVMRTPNDTGTVWSGEQNGRRNRVFIDSKI